MFVRSRMGLITVTTVVVVLLYCSTVYRPLGFGSRGGYPSFRYSSSSKCSPDPYRRNGYLSIPPTGKSYEDTTWLPYDSALFEDAADFVTHATIRKRNDVEPASTDGGSDKDEKFVYFENDRPTPKDLERAGAPPNWMRALKTSRENISAGKPANPYLEWLRNKRVLVFGDSIDRHMMAFFCDDLRGKQSGTKHKSAYCHVKEYNFTLLHWHVASMYTSRPSFWWLQNMKTVDFESRWEEMYRPEYPRAMSDFKSGSKPRPDLIIFNSGLWDMRVFQEVGRHRPDDPLLSEGDNKALHKALDHSGRLLTWSESKFFVARTRDFIKKIRSEFGKDVPLMYRTLTKTRPGHRYSPNDSMLGNLDHLNRFLMEEHDIEVFEWAKLIETLSELYLDYLHFGHGGASWLWSNMMLQYLHREVTQGWEMCHRKEMEWASRRY